eukprot:scaffold97047_cov54-Phaeocystis_antarctica.AAC.3
MDSARLRHQSARLVFWAFTAGAVLSAADRSKCVAAFLSSAAERGPTSKEPYAIPLSTNARMLLACVSFGATLTTLADSAVSPSSFHHSGLATSAHSFVFSRSKAFAVAFAQFSEPTANRPLASRYRLRLGHVGPQGDGLAVGPGLSANVLFRAVPQALSKHLIVRVARLSGDAGLPLRGLAIPLVQRPTICLRLPLLPQLLVKRPVQLPSARVRRAVDAAEVRRRQLLITALFADGVLLAVVVHV